MIIDSHLHLGECNVFDLDISEDDVLRAMDASGVDKAVVLPLPGCIDPRRTHDRIAEFAAANPGRIYGFASMNPHVPLEQFQAEMTRCIKDLHFTGVKLHTFGHAVSPMSRDGRRVFAVAAELGVPMIIHTGAGIPFSLPGMVISLANEYPQTPMILAHAGFGIEAMEAMIAAKTCPNIYLETSWCVYHNITLFVKNVGAEKVMFGSDLQPNIAVELTKYRQVSLTDGQREQIMWQTASRVFGIPV